jgi:hypothetical protein
MALLARRASILALLVLVALAVPSFASAKVANEYDLKAAFLFHFAQFVEWPAEAMPNKNTPLTIGILGGDPFGKTLDAMVANEAVRGHKLVVRRFREVGEADSCQILFISPSEDSRLGPILSHLKGRSILTVGEGKGFALRSGIVGFVLSDRRLRLAVNLAAANACRLTISSKLLRQSEIVGPAGVPE